MWEPAETAPFDRDLELAVINEDGENSLVFPCRRTELGWQHARTWQLLDIDPTHWRDWQAEE